MVIDGYRWSLMLIGGYQWLSMVIDGDQWLLMVIDGYQWLSMRDLPTPPPSSVYTKLYRKIMSQNYVAKLSASILCRKSG